MLQFEQPLLLLLLIPMTLLFSRLRAAQRSIPLAGEQKVKRQARICAELKRHSVLAA